MNSLVHLKPFKQMQTSLTTLVVVVFSLTMIGMNGCSLDIPNPNQPSDLQVLSTREGLSALTVGVQQTYATTGMEVALLISGTTTREVAADINQVPFVELEDGGVALPNLNSHVADLWNRMFRIISMCDQLIANAPNVAMPAGTRSGILATARLFKAMCLGHLAVAFERFPIQSGTPAAPAAFVTRQQGLEEALSLLAAAADGLRATPPSADFNNQVLVRGFNLANTIAAMRARFAGMAGRHQEAITFANAVDVTAAGRSEFRYDNSLNPNPIFFLTSVTIRWAPRQNLGLPSSLVDTADARIRFFVTPRPMPSVLRSFPVGSYTTTSFFGSLTSAIPAFRPGEMALIRAEANLRLNNLDACVSEINSIRTKAPDYLGLAARLPAYSGARTVEALQEEIYRQRSAELFLTGLRMDDMRRLGRPAPATGLTSERTRNFYPYPLSERDNNPNVPPDPAI